MGTAEWRLSMYTMRKGSQLLRPWIHHWRLMRLRLIKAMGQAP